MQRYANFSSHTHVPMYYYAFFTNPALLLDGDVQVATHHELLPRILAELHLSALCNNFNSHSLNLLFRIRMSIKMIVILCAFRIGLFDVFKEKSCYH